MVGTTVAIAKDMSNNETARDALNRWPADRTQGQRDVAHTFLQCGKWLTLRQFARHYDTSYGWR